MYTASRVVVITDGLGDTAVNNTYLVQPVAACGAVQTTPSNRTGEFDYSLKPGQP